MDANGALKQLKDQGKHSIRGYDIVVLDEGSMVSTKLLEHILEKIDSGTTKLVMIADKSQLPPVEEKISPIWQHFPIDFELTQVMRHCNSILTFVQSIRNNPNPVFVSPGPDVFIEDDDSFIEKIEESAHQDLFHTGQAKVIAWRNVTVNFFNQLIREAHSPGLVDEYVVGDRIVFHEPHFRDSGKLKIALAHTDQEGMIMQAAVTKHARYLVRTWKLSIKLDRGATITVYALHKDSKPLVQEMLSSYATDKKWSMFWTLKESFAAISHAYAMTTHRSQGSTIPITYIVAGDILMNRNIDERTQMLYVATSRASSKLHIFV
jgi:exodeoxyribonuclease-5